ncbi:efflux RND transporter periplasmic adaptor subunit [Mesorhizobium sp. NZP2298]|uniref:efflux RND transporter periplasmic adaptor subunit n=1 Tax=Mesorhizobium sp. NZP2298 TaxID=2483403 RepID=UPI0015542A98|nr:HlyD family secretion protein [Mesorhizobium sp. NZP2298]QKC94362.1 HlyD family secretion protein [Mesorhizobium sp. NZP2298]
MKYRFLRLTGRILVTAIVVVVACVAAWKLWDDNMNAPWTRDAHVRADVVGVTPDVSGLVAEVMVKDNQAVKKGDALFQVDRQRFAVALAQAQAVVEGKQATLDQAKRNLDRLQRLTASAVSVQQIEEARSAVAEAESESLQASASRDLAQLNLDRSKVRAPVNGIITNLSLRPGDYVAPGTATMALVDTDTMRIEGYFEETKLPRIGIGAKASIRLMGWPNSLSGHVASIAAGIADRERSSGTLLADINPTFTWVRLAQRVPVHIVIDSDAATTARLVAGTSATVTIDRATAQ